MIEEDWEHWNIWETAKSGLRRATDSEISGVTIREIHRGWMLVVPEPWNKHSHPIIVIGGVSY